MTRVYGLFSALGRKHLRAGFYLGCLLGSFATTASAGPQNPPPGSYATSCQDIHMEGTTLRAACRNYWGGLQATGLADAATCIGTFKDVNGTSHFRDIYNVDGTLRCTLANSFAHGKYQEGFDIISMPKTVPHGSGGATATFWRIDRPDVWSSKIEGEADYPMITFKPGDLIHVVAGGCVQTGGMGSTWKSYTDPQGSDAEQYYSGTIFIPGVTLGRFQKIGPFMREGWHTVPPAPPGSHPADFLKLGYLDNQMDDNGYYSHDNGNNDQCKNIGPAWVEVSVISGLPQNAGPLLSPHSKPFDLVWDMAKDEDPNGLPLNPQWNYTLQHPGQQPHFIPLCGKALPSQFLVGTYEIDMGPLAQICTSMSPNFDLHPMGGGICGGDPFPGHLDFGVATYQGRLNWEAWSGNAAGTQDNDWSFALKPRNAAGLAGKDDSLAPGTDIHSEFDIGEVLGLTVTPFWHDLFFWPGPAGMPSPAIGSIVAGPDGEGLDAVVIGEVGLDGVHGANTELHPVFAMAVRVSELRDPQRPDVMVDKWAFFLRNFGDGGFCSSMLSFWDTGGDYFIPLEYPANTTRVVGVGETAVVRWQDAATPVGIQDDAAQKFSVIRVTPPPGGGGWGVSGMVTLLYNVPPEKKQKAAPPKQKQQAKQQYVETEGKNLSPERIANSAARAKYEAELKALPPMTKARPATTFAVQVPTTVSPYKHTPGHASHGVLVRARLTPNTTKLEWDLQMYKIMQTYQKDLKIELPAELTPKVLQPEPK